MSLLLLAMVAGWRRRLAVHTIINWQKCRSCVRRYAERAKP